jgi:spectinomycin phosphotransferase
MFIGAGVGNVWNMQREVELFYTGYGITEINITIIDYYRCERIIQDIAEYHRELCLANGGLKDRLTNYNHFLAMFEPNGVVDIALRAID